jgi:hypothetical protein
MASARKHGINTYKKCALEQNLRDLPKIFRVLTDKIFHNYSSLLYSKKNQLWKVL